VQLEGSDDFYFSIKHNDAHLWNAGGSVFWRDAKGTVGLSASYFSVDAPAAPLFSGKKSAQSYGAFGEYYVWPNLTLQIKGGGTTGPTGSASVYGGGGITPDVVAGDSTAPLAEGNFMRALGADAGHFRDAVTDYALFLKGSGGITTPDFVVTPAMRDEVWNRMKARGIDIPRSVYDEAEPLVSRVIAFDIARYVFGSEAEFRRRASVDKPLLKALELAHGANSEQDLLRRATAEAPSPEIPDSADGGGGQ
jgi:hypothetical protein